MNAGRGTSPDLTRRATTVAMVAALCLQTSAARSQQQAPLRLERILVGAPPGGTPDVMARHYAARLGKVVVENRPGAVSMLSVSALMQAPPDGATVLLGSGGLLSFLPFLYARLPYDPATDLVPVCAAGELSFALAIGPLVPAAVRSLSDFAQWARGNPALASYGSPGEGSILHVLGVLLAREAGYPMQHVPYVGGPPAIADALGGRVAAVILPHGLLRPLHDAGKLRILATSSAKRSPRLPEVPTLVELGYERLVISDWFGFFVPRGTAAAVIDTTASAVQAVAAKTDLAAALDEVGVQVLVGTTTQMNERIARERQYWRDALPATGIRLN